MVTGALCVCFGGVGWIITAVFLWNTVVLQENESQEASPHSGLSRESVEKLVSLYGAVCVAGMCYETSGVALSLLA